MAPPAYGIQFVDGAGNADGGFARHDRHQADGGPVQDRANAAAAACEGRLPDGLRAGLESLSGLDLSSVRVQYNSARPTRLEALAFTTGRNIHIAPGQERHLPHEGWHAVQQMQGRVKLTIQTRGAAINDDPALEHEADVMGARALAMRSSQEGASAFPIQQPSAPPAFAIGNGPVQMKPVYRGMMEDAGKPALGESARKLGVRPGTDITIRNGTAIHDGKGMSTAPDYPGNLREHRRPPEWGGTGKDPVWEADSKNLTNDKIEWHEDKPGRHGIVRPKEDMPYADFRSALEGTQNRWSKKTPATSIPTEAKEET